MTRKSTLIPVLIFMLFALQHHAQDDQQITMNTPIEGAVDSAGDSQVWQFSALREDVLSFRVEGQGDFDPTLTIQNSNGTVIIANDDYNYPASNDALLEAITIPQTGDYEVVVTGFEDSTGDFTLTMLPGYSNLVLDERFTSENGWDIADPLTAEISDGQLTLEISGIQQSGSSTITTIDPLSNFYAQTTVTSIQHRGGWTIGFNLRQQVSGDTYRVVINSQGMWRFTAIEDGTERIVRDWTPHPAIVPGETSFTFAILAHGIGFDIFYNRQIIGSVSDSAISQPGQLSLVLTSSNTLDSMIRAVFDEMIVTMPIELDGAMLFPERLIRGGSTLTVSELERRYVIPGGGQLVLSVEESTFEGRSPGVFPLVLARGTQFQNFAIGTTVSLQSPVIGGVGGCGLLVRNQGETDYMVAYTDTAGGFGVSQRNGDTFEQGLYVENPEWDLSQPNDLLLVLNADRLDYFVNGYHAGSMEIESVSGEIGNVVVNFDPVLTQCRFDDTWVWRWE